MQNPTLPPLLVLSNSLARSSFPIFPAHVERAARQIESFSCHKVSDSRDREANRVIRHSDILEQVSLLNKNSLLRRSRYQLYLYLDAVLCGAQSRHFRSDFPISVAPGRFLKNLLSNIILVALELGHNVVNALFRCAHSLVHVMLC